MTLPSLALAPTQVKPRFGEQYLSEAVNTKFLGQPRGIYLGFIPKVTPGSLALTLAPDPTYGLSLARVKSSLETTNVDVISETSITIDFGLYPAHDFIANPVVYVKVNAQSQLGTPTSASIYTTALPGETSTDQVICVVTKPGADLVVAYDAPFNRSTPFAYLTGPSGGANPRPFGFMGDSAVNELLQAVAMVAEVAAARVDLNGVTHPYDGVTEWGISDRIAADLQPAAISGRLGLQHRILKSNDYLLGSSTASLNVSSSFCGLDRTALPAVDIAPFGSETSAGAITGGTGGDNTRNTCFVLLVGKNERPTDTDRAVAYGRLTATVQAIPGTLTFNGTVNVTGAATNFQDPTTGVQVGDLLLCSDGKYRTIATIAATPTQTLTLTSTAPAGALASTRRRYILNLLKRNLGNPIAELPYSAPASSTVRFFFSTWFDLAHSIHDSTLLMFEGGEETPLPDAAVGVKGKVMIDPNWYTDQPNADPPGCGAVNVVNAGATVGDGTPCFSINFSSASTVSASGVADIASKGITGNPGPPGAGIVGATGPKGPDGSGFVYEAVHPGAGSFNPAFPGPNYSTPNSPGTLLTFDTSWGFPLLYLHGGASYWELTGHYADANDNFNIVAVAFTNAGKTASRLTMKIPTTGGGFPTNFVGFFMNGGG